MSAANIQINNGVTVKNGVTVDGSNRNTINHNGLKLYLDAFRKTSYQNLTTIGAQNVSGSDGATGFFFRPNSPDYQLIAVGWTVVNLPGAVVTAVSCDPNDGYTTTVTVSGATFTAGASYAFTNVTTWYDISGNGNHVTMTDPTHITYTDTDGKYFTLSEPGYFTNSNPTGLPVKSSPYHFSAWVQWPSGSWPSSGGIMSIGNAWGTDNQVNAFRTTTTNGFVNYWWGNDFAVSTALATTQWCNVVAQWDGTTRSIWANGQLIGSQAADSLDVSNNFLQIGMTYTGGGENLAGNIGQVLIYNRALAPLEIQNNFNSTRARYGI